jgi:excinuclease UvrABC helicase subunit UvrB
LNEVSEVDEINEIIKNIRKCDIEIYKIRKDEYYSVFNEKMNMDIAKLETEKQNLLDKLNKYKNLLIEGRIWDASAILKKMKPISDYGMMQTIDEFNKDIDKIRYKTIEGSFDKIAVFWFNLNETPNIRKLLINHYAKQLAELKNNNLALDIF